MDQNQFIEIRNRLVSIAENQKLLIFIGEKILSAQTDLQDAVTREESSVSAELSAVIAAIQAGQTQLNGAVPAGVAESVVARLNALSDKLDAETKAATPAAPSTPAGDAAPVTVSIPDPSTAPVLPADGTTPITMPNGSTVQASPATDTQSHVSNTGTIPNATAAVSAPDPLGLNHPAPANETPAAANPPAPKPTGEPTPTPAQ